MAEYTLAGVIGTEAEVTLTSRPGVVGVAGPPGPPSFLVLNIGQSVPAGTPAGTIIFRR